VLGLWAGLVLLLLGGYGLVTGIIHGRRLRRRQTQGRDWP
jgi:hypothetical protein